MWVIELEPGVWVCGPDGRTIVLENASRFETERSGKRRLGIYRKRFGRSFPRATVCEMKDTTAPAPGQEGGGNG